MVTVNTKFLQINMIVFQIGNVKGLTENPSRRLWHISIPTDYRIYCQLCWLNVTLKMYTLLYKINVILLSWPRRQITQNKHMAKHGHRSKRQANLHNLSYSQSYIMVRSHITT